MGGGQPGINRPVNRVSGALARIEAVFIAVSAVAMAAIMVIVAADVMLRYVFSSPFSWSYNIIGLYLLGAVFFLALSDTLQHHGHVALDLFVPLMPLRLQHFMQAFGYAVSAAFVAVIAWLAFTRAEDALLSDDRIAASVAFPTWIAYAILTAGTSLLVLRALYRAVFHAASAIAGRDLVELPPPPETGDTRGERAE